ncbi:MAG TPA: tripartite tricarboxylate transporter substrate binding protein [Burkholderiaceae bacterium]|nr:tripartite tricarboxylate transporter substrate binding protein [Burkholderiaceae bacterium]
MTPIRHTTVALAALLAALPATTLAQSWPERPVRLVIPFPPGGTLDKVGRMLAQELGKSLGQTFIVENKPGGNGVIGGDSVAKAPADGYTLLFNASTFVTAPMTMKSVPYKVQADFVPISLVAQAPLSIAIGNKLGVQDVKGLVAAAKAKPGALNFAVGSIGSAGHLCTVRLEQAAGISVGIVPYKGTAPAFQDLIGGQIEGFIDPVLGSVQFHRGKQLHVVAVTAAKRLPNLPDVPTASETLPGFECASWYGLWAPAKTSIDIVDKLNAAVNKALGGEMRERLVADGLVPGGGSPADFAKFQADDIAASGKIIAEKKISVEQ